MAIIDVWWFWLSSTKIIGSFCHQCITCHQYHYYYSFNYYIFIFIQPMYLQNNALVGIIDLRILRFVQTQHIIHRQLWVWSLSAPVWTRLGPSSCHIRIFGRKMLKYRTFSVCNPGKAGRELYFRRRPPTASY